jgi:hypothetical protein
VKSFKFIIYIALIIFTATATSFGWGYITHTYFSNSLGASTDPANANEIYGSVLSDAFNMDFTPQGQYMYEMLHHQYTPFVQNAWSADLKSVAYGVELHNDNNGADYTAHHNAFTLSDEGYAVYWGNEMAPAITPYIKQIYINAGLDDTTAATLAKAASPLLGHIMIEDGVDLLIKYNIDPQIGLKLRQAAQKRTDDTPLLLADVFAPGLAKSTGITIDEAEKYIVSGEISHKHLIAGWGAIFKLKKGNDIQALSLVDAQMGEAYLEALSGVDVTVAPELVSEFLMMGMRIAEPTYRSELDQTLAYLRETFTAPSSKMAEKEKLKLKTTTPGSFTLHANYPNPFNPATTIPYEISESGPVTLRIFNSLGQEVACLVNGIQEAGQYTVTWNSGDLSGGVYFCRLSTSTGYALKKMMLVK